VAGSQEHASIHEARRVDRGFGYQEVALGGEGADEIGQLVCRDRPGQQVRSDLKRFKQIMESGSMVRTLKTNG
jgi:uncharacterized membrane protein